MTSICPTYMIEVQQGEGISNLIFSLFQAVLIPGENDGLKHSSKTLKTIFIRCHRVAYLEMVRSRLLLEIAVGVMEPAGQGLVVALGHVGVAQPDSVLEHVLEAPVVLVRRLPHDEVRVV